MISSNFYKGIISFLFVVLSSSKQSTGIINWMPIIVVKSDRMYIFDINEMAQTMMSSENIYDTLNNKQLIYNSYFVN